MVQSESQSISSEMNADADVGEPTGTTESQVEEEIKAGTEVPIKDPSDQLKTPANATTEQLSNFQSD